MYLQITLINAILFASLANASDTKPSTSTENFSPTTATTFPASENIVLGTGAGVFIPDFILDEDVALTPDESQLRRVNLGKIFARLSEFTPGKKGKSSRSQFDKTGEVMTTMTPETGGQDTNTLITSASAFAPDSDNVGDTNSGYNAVEEGNTDLDASPEETELRRGGRGGRRRGRGHFGRGGRFGRFGDCRFGRFGSWGSGWNDDCGGDDCGDC